MRDGEIETTVVPRNPLDVLAQQIVAMVATGDDWRVPELHELVKRAYPYSELSAASCSTACSTCSTAATPPRSSPSCGRGSSGTGWRTPSARARARCQLAVTNAGTIPDRGLFGVHLPDGRRVGELDEEMVYEARAGPDVHARRVDLADRGDHARPRDRDPRARRARARCPSGAATAWAGPAELGRAIGEFARDGGRPRARGAGGRATTSTSAPPRNLVAYLREQQEATRVVPSDRTIVVERFRDEIGDWRLCVLSPFGGRVHAAWGLALSARIRDQFGLESDAIWSDDGIIVHLPDADEPPGAELVLVEPDELEELVVRELSASALYGARFRENAARALLLPRAYPGKRTPLWQQRLKAQSLLEVAKRYGQFPIVLETYRECLRDVLDLPGPRGAAARAAHARAVAGGGGDPARLAVRLVAAVRLRGHLHVRGRHAQRGAPRRRALARPRPAARAARPGGAARPDRPGRAGRGGGRPAAAQRAHARRQRRRPARRAARGRRPDHRRGAGALPCRRCRRSGCSATWRRSGARCGCASAARSAGSPPRTPASTATPSAPCRPAGCPPRSSRRTRSRSTASCAATRAPTARSPRASRPTATRSTSSPALRELEQRGRPGPRRAAPRRLASASGATPRCCGGCAAPRWPRCARRSSPPSSARSRASCPPGRASTRRRPAARAWTACARCSCRCRAWRWRPRCGSRTCCRAASAPTRPPWIDQLCASGELVWVGAGALGRARARWRCYFREDARWLGPPPFKGEPPERADPRRAPRAARAGAPRSGADLLADLVDAPEPAELQEALWDLVWAGEVTNDAFAPLRAPAPRRWPEQQREQGRRFSRRRRPGAPQVQGRWSLTERLFADAPAHGPRMRAIVRAAAGALRHRDARDRAGRGHPRRLRRRSTASWRTSRRSAPPAAATSWRAWAARSSRCRPPSSGCAACAPTSPPGALVLATTDPANPFGATLPWPKREGENRRRPAACPAPTS